MLLSDNSVGSSLLCYIWVSRSLLYPPVDTVGDYCPLSHNLHYHGYIRHKPNRVWVREKIVVCAVVHTH